MNKHAEAGYQPINLPFNAESLKYILGNKPGETLEDGAVFIRQTPRIAHGYTELEDTGVATLGKKTFLKGACISVCYGGQSEVSYFTRVRQERSSSGTLFGFYDIYHMPTATEIMEAPGSSAAQTPRYLVDLSVNLGSYVFASGDLGRIEAEVGNTPVLLGQKSLGRTAVVTQTVALYSKDESRDLVLPAI